MLKQLHYTLVLTLLITISNGQGGFKRSIVLPTTKQHVSQGIVETTPNNYVHVGIVVDTLNGYQTPRLCITGVNQSGQVQWVKKYGNHKFIYTDNPFRSQNWIKKIDNYIYYASGIIDSSNIRTGILIKLNYLGDTIWQKKYFTNIDFIAITDVTKSYDNGFLLQGLITNTATGAALLTIKTNNLGHELWRKKIHKPTTNGPDDQYANAIIQDSITKKIITVGYQAIGNSTSWTYYHNIVITDSLGNFLERRNYMTNAPGVLSNIIKTKDGKYIAVGDVNYFEYINGYAKNYGYAVKFDINNLSSTPIWQKNSLDNQSPINYYNNVIELNNGNLVIAGTHDTSYMAGIGFEPMGKITWLDKNGNVLKKRFYKYNYDYNHRFYSRSFYQTNDKGYISNFNVEVAGALPSKFFIVKYDSLGCDTTAAYCATVGFKELNYNLADVSIYPQPAKDVVFLKSELFDHKMAQVQLYNVLGQVVFTKELQFNQGGTQLNLSNLPKGIYTLKLVDEERRSFTSKIIKE